MTTALTVLVAVALVGFLVAHVVLLAVLVRTKPRYRAFVALVVPPLAPYWAWSAGGRRAVWAWGAALALYSAAVIAILR